MNWTLTSLLALCGVLALLIYRGSKSFLRAALGAVAIPLLALLAIALLVPRDLISEASGAGFIVLLIGTVIFMIWREWPD